MNDEDSERRRSFRDFITFRMNRTARQLDRFAERYYHQLFGLRLTELRIIGAIGYKADITFKQVCELADLEKGHASRLMTNIVDKGLVSKSDNLKDQRSSFLKLTDTGIALFDTMHGAAQALNECLLDALTAEQADSLQAGLVLVHDRLLSLNAAGDPVAVVDGRRAAEDWVIDRRDSLSGPPAIDLELARSLHSSLGAYLDKLD